MTKKPPKLSDQDKLDFEDAMKGINRLTAHGRHTDKPKPAKPKRRHTTPDFNHSNTPNIYYSRDNSSLGPEDRLNFERPHLLSKDIKRLKKGDFNKSIKLDLHEYTVEQAIDALHHFISACRTEGIQFALIVHGKGTYSAAGVPVLKNMLNQWLRNHPNVLAFHTAKPRDGGSGAVYVLFKSKGPFDE